MPRFLGRSRAEAFLMARSATYPGVCSMVLVDRSCFIVTFDVSSLCMESASFLFTQRVIEPIRTGMMPCFVSFSESDLLPFVLNQ